MATDVTSPPATQHDARLGPLLSRRSVSPRGLTAPGPTAAELALVLQAALHAPDHGRLQPWRVLEFGADERPALATLFEQEKLRRDPLATQHDLQRAREHALQCPTLLAFVVAIRPRSAVPEREQWLAAGAALGAMLQAAHQQGYGAIVLSGERCFDPVLTARLGLADGEQLAGFVSMGSIAAAPPPAPRTATPTAWTRWLP